MGLTATAVKDEFGGWSLEAGAMVLADNGNVCIDEFDKMREEDRSAIHEALEQQTISISKAGITTTLNSRCSVLAAANPKFGSFDEYKSVTEQIKLSSPILSRFDLIFIIKDRVDKERDKNIAMSILLSWHIRHTRKTLTKWAIGHTKLSQSSQRTRIPTTRKR